MKTLALDTSGLWGSVALLSDGHTLEERIWASPPSHSETLLQHLEEILQAQNLALQDLDLFAVTVGPGSFTGLRVGISTVLALRKVYPVPAAAVNTLEALVFRFGIAGQPMAAVVKAGWGEFYTGAYRSGRGEKWEEISAPELRPKEALKPWLDSLPAETVLLAEAEVAALVGQGGSKHAEKNLLADRPGVLASAVGELATRLFKQGKVQAGRPLCPLYLRPSEAEVRLSERQKV